MDERLEKLEREVEALKERNRRVEGDKAWETSWARMFTISLATYVVAAALLYIVEVEEFLLAAFVPTLGYVLSTQSLPTVQRWWLARG